MAVNSRNSQPDGIDNHAFITGPNGVGVTELKSSLSVDVGVSGINDLGQAVGDFADPSTGLSHAFITGPNGMNMTDLGTLGGLQSSTQDINNSGQVVGGSDTVNENLNAFITGLHGTGMTNLGTLGTLGGFFSSATDINDSGEVTGFAETANGDVHSFLFSHGGITDLSLLDVVVAAGWTELGVTDINDNGQIVGTGFVDSEGHNRQEFLLSYTPDTLFTPNPIFIPGHRPPPPIPEPQTYAMLLAGLGLIGFMARRRKEVAV